MEENSRIVIAIVSGLLAYLAASLYYCSPFNKARHTRLIIGIIFVLLHGCALYYAIRETGSLTLPQTVTIAGWVLLPVFTMMIIYSLFIELPSWKTYSQEGTPNALVTTGTYALVRHPGVVWYILALAALILATGSTGLLIAAPVWALFDIIFATVEDKVLFPKMFPEYRQYQQRTPMFIPTPNSFLVCLKTLKDRYGTKNEMP